MFEHANHDAFFPHFPTPWQAPHIHPAAPPAYFLPMASIEAVYQSAAARACRDHEMDKLFNPDYYEEQDTGI